MVAVSTFSLSRWMLVRRLSISWRVAEPPAPPD
jgi:hypothetical protein